MPEWPSNKHPFHSTFLIRCWGLERFTRGCVFSALLSIVLSNSYQNPTTADFRYKSLNSWKIDNIDLTKHFSLSIFTDFRFQSIKITWLLSIFFYCLLRVVVRYSVQGHPLRTSDFLLLASFLFETACISLFIPADISDRQICFFSGLIDEN